MKIIGHQKIINLLDKAIAKDAVSQAYLFAGPEHVGKFTVAMDFAEKLVGEGGKTNGNLIIVAPEIEEKKGIIKKKDIKIEQIRDLQHQLSLSAQGGKYKIAIIDEADRLNKAAQNALLKTLEESAEKIMLILVSQDEKRMLPTILSRCQKIRLGAVPDAELKKNIMESKDREEIIFWALGRPGMMLDLVKNQEELVFRKEASQELKNLLSQNLAERFALAENMAKDVNQATKKLELWVLILREAMFGRAGNIRVSSEKALWSIENIKKSLELVKDTNANVRLLMERLFLEI